MERTDLLDFLETVGAGSLESYLGRHGDDSVSALEERMQWAAWNFRDPDNAAEANFLMQHHEPLRDVLEEGETAWHLRLKRQEMGVDSRGTPMPAPPPIPSRLGHSVKPDELPGRTVADRKPPTPAPPPQRLPQHAETVPDSPRPAPAPSLRDLKPAGVPPPLSEAPTEIHEVDDPRDRWDEPTAQLDRNGNVIESKKRMPARGGSSYKPSNASSSRPSLADVPRPTGNVEGLGLGIEKTAYSMTPAPVGPRTSRIDPHSERPPEYTAGPQPASNTTFLLLGVGLTIAGIGAFALAGAIIFGATQTPPEAPPPAPKPSLEGVLPG